MLCADPCTVLCCALCGGAVVSGIMQYRDGALCCALYCTLYRVPYRSVLYFSVRCHCCVTRPLVLSYYQYSSSLLLPLFHVWQA